jgi:single-strand DNA-binding protein
VAVKVTIDGNLVAEPELRFIPSGDAVVKLRVASNERKKDANGEWVNVDSVFLDVSAWRDLAEGAAETLKKGSRVVITGKLKQREYQKDGQTRIAFEVSADEITTSVRARRTTQPVQGEMPAW